jgi:hypothetical protein
MRNVFIVVLVLFVSVFSLDKVTTPYTAVSKAVISAAGTNQNRDSLRIAINRTIDTVVAIHDSLNTRAIRATAAVAADSVNARSIQTTANITADSINTRAIKMANILTTTNFTADSIYTAKIGITGTFLCTLGSLTATVVGTAKYKKIGNFVTVLIPPLWGTSNSTDCWLKGWPGILQSTSQILVSDLPMLDNGVFVNGQINIYQNGGYPAQLQIFKNGSATWTSSGTKGFVLGGSVDYVSISYYQN